MLRAGRNMAQSEKSIRGPALLGFIVVSLGFTLYAYSRGWLSRELIEGAVEQAGPWGMVAFVAAVVLCELLWLPRAWGLIAGGVLFSPWVAIPLCFTADMTAAAICYLLGRGGGRAWAESLLAKRPKSQRVVEILAKQKGVVTLAVLRIVPVAHYTAVSYAAGISGVQFRSYLLGTAIGLLPYAILYPIAGHEAMTPTSPTFLLTVAVVVAAFIASGLLMRKVLGSSEATQSSETSEKGSGSAGGGKI